MLELIITVIFFPLLVRILSTIFEWWWLKHHDED